MDIHNCKKKKSEMWDKSRNYLYIFLFGYRDEL